MKKPKETDEELRINSERNQRTEFSVMISKKSLNHRLIIGNQLLNIWQEQDRRKKGIWGKVVFGEVEKCYRITQGKSETLAKSNAIDSIMTTSFVNSMNFFYFVILV